MNSIQICPMQYIKNNTDRTLWISISTSLFTNGFNEELAEVFTGIIVEYYDLDAVVLYHSYIVRHYLKRLHIMLFANLTGEWWHDSVDRMVICRWFDFLKYQVNNPHQRQRKLRLALDKCSKLCESYQNHLIIITRSFVQIEEFRLSMSITNPAFVLLLNSI